VKPASLSNVFRSFTKQQRGNLESEISSLSGCILLFMHELHFEIDLVFPMAQSNTSRKSVGIVHGWRDGAQIRTSQTSDRSLVNSGAACSPREAMNYVAEMAESLADLAEGADNREIVSLLRTVGRKARLAAATN
jgi:hypothetical protein